MLLKIMFRYLGDDLVVAIVSNDLNLASVLLVEGKRVVLIISALLGIQDLVPGLLRVLLVSNHLRLVLPALGLLAAAAVVEDLLVVGVLDLDLGTVSKHGWSASSLLWAGDALLVDVVPVLVLWAGLLLPHAAVGVALQVLLTVVRSGGLEVDVLLVTLSVGGGEVGLAVLLTLLGLALTTGGSSQNYKFNIK